MRSSIGCRPKSPTTTFCSTRSTANPLTWSVPSSRSVRRARACPDLTMRVHDGCRADLPAVGANAPSGPSSVVRHDLPDRSWHGLPGGGGRPRQWPAGHSPDALAATRLHPGARHSGRRWPGHSRGHAGPACRWPTVSELGDGGVALWPGRTGARGGAAADGLLARGGPSMPAAPIAGWFAIPAPGCCTPGRGCGRRWRPTPDRTAPARCDTLVRHRCATARSDGHRRGAGGGVHGAVRPARRVGRFAGRRGADGQTRCCRQRRNHFGNVAVGLYPGLGIAMPDRADRDRFGEWPPSFRASGYPGSRPRLRRGTRAAVALGCLAIRRRCPAGAGRRQHRGVQR